MATSSNVLNTATPAILESLCGLKRLFGSCLSPAAFMLEERLGTRASKARKPRLGNKKNKSLIARVPYISTCKGSWDHTTAVQLSQKKAKLTVVEVDPKKGRARKDRKGRGSDIMDEVLDMMVVYVFQTKSVNKFDRP